MDSLLRRIEEHRLKIEIERSKESGDHGLIRRWQAEIDSFEVSVARAKKRLRS